MNNLNLLIVEDNRGVRATYDLMLGDNYQFRFATTCEEARRFLAKGVYDLILMDIELPDGNGLDLLQEVRAERPDQEIVMCSSQTDANFVVEAIKRGATDFIPKPIDKEILFRTLDRRTKTKQLTWEKTVLLQKVEASQKHTHGIVGQSLGMQHIIETVRKLKGTNSTVLLLGESGVGKEVIAHAIHQQEGDPCRPFVAVNCAAIPENLLESELFGHEKGAFTGASQTRKGKFVQANGGDIFLDEIACMTPMLQAKLLRVIQDKAVEPLGSNKAIQCNFRVIAATNHDIKKEIEQGKFRQDLYYRLQGMEMYIPPLRTRPEDIPLLVEFILKDLVAQCGVRHFNQEAMKVLMSYPWPGNVRELKNTVENILILNRDEVLTEKHLPPTLKGRKPRERTSLLKHLRANMKNYERDVIVAALKRYRGNKSKAAKELGISRSILYRKMNALGMEEKELS